MIDGLLAQLASQRDEVEKARAETAYVRAAYLRLCYLLQEIEWAGPGQACPSCGTVPHRDSCRLQQALALMFKV